MPKITNANELTAYALKVFRKAGFFCWRENSVGIYDTQRQVFRRNPDSLTGKSDILGFHEITGQVLAAEIKAGADRLSKAQEVFLLKVRNAGGIAIVVKHADDVRQYLEGDHAR